MANDSPNDGRVLQRLGSSGWWPAKIQSVLVKNTVHTALGLDDRGILIAGTNFASSKDGKVGGSWIDTYPPARRRSGHLNVVATIEQREDRRLN